MNCKRCVNCEGQRHHWMEDIDEESEIAVLTCKHCEESHEYPDKSLFLETANDRHWFYFVCEGCGEEGELGIHEELRLRQIACPAKCGSSYILWNDPIKNQPDLKCVVCPVFA